MDSKEYLIKLEATIEAHERMMIYHQEMITTLRKIIGAHRETVAIPCKGGKREVQGGRNFLPYSNALAEEVVAKIAEYGEAGSRSGDLARALGYPNGYALKTVLQKLHQQKRLRGEMQGNGSHVRWYSAGAT